MSEQPIGEQLRLEASDPPDSAPEIGPATPEQREAIESRDRSVFLEAGAGTGKTRVLVDRYCQAVATDGVAPDRILAFTFTERAAGEMRRRVRRQLARRSAIAEQAGERERARELSAFARAGEGAWVTTIHGFCRRLLASHPAAAGLDPKFRVLDQSETNRLAADAFAQALERLAVDDERVAALAAGFTGARLRELVLSVHDEHHSRGIKAPELPEITAVATQLGDEGEHAAEEIDGRIGALRALLGEFARCYAGAKRQRSGLDFEDLQLEALRLLGDKAEIRASYQERFEHILVDEFQDTNPVQVALVHALCGPGAKLFTVGDEFQSIYSFRHADLEVFRAQRERAKAGHDEGRSAVLALRGSFRSSPDVVGAVNAIGAALLEDFAPLTVGTADPPQPVGALPAIELLLTERKGWDDELLGEPTVDSQPRRVAEARFLASRLRALAEDGEPLGGMTVLLRAFTHVAVFEDELRRAGLNPLVVGGRGYWSHQQVDDTLRLLACVANPLDDESLLGALASPACGVSADGLMILRLMAGKRRHLWPTLEQVFGPEGEQGEPASDWALKMPPADEARLRLFSERLASLRGQAAIRSLEGLLIRTLNTFEYDLDTLLRDGGPRRLANAQKLAGLAADFEAHEGRDLRGFLDNIRARAAASEAEPEAATESEGHDGVRVMTVHAAKGLEFDVVAVGDLGRSLIVGGARPDVRLGFAASLSGARERPATRVGVRISLPGRPPVTLGELTELTDEAAAGESAEARRLTYVAASRAKRRLLLSGHFSPAELAHQDEMPHSATALARLLPTLGVSETSETVLAPAPGPRPGLKGDYPQVRIAVRFNGPERGTVAARVERLDRDQTTHPRPSGAPPLLGEVDPDPAAERHLSYAALADYGRCGYRYYVERVLGLRAPGAPWLGGAQSDSDEAPLRGSVELPIVDADRATNPGARLAQLGFGNAVHSLLERSVRSRWARPPSDAIRAALRREGLAGNSEEIERVEAMIDGWLASDLVGELDGSPGRPRPEVPFLFPIGAATILRGTIDLLVERPGQSPMFVDYKTDALSGSDPAQLTMERYETQRGLYALAIANATGSETVEAAYVFLDRPDAPHRSELGAAELQAAADRLSSDIAGVRESRFEVTPTPHASLCFDCPARERLCSYGPERTLASGQSGTPASGPG